MPQQSRSNQRGTQASASCRLSKALSLSLHCSSLAFSLLSACFGSDSDSDARHALQTMLAYLFPLLLSVRHNYPLILLDRRHCLSHFFMSHTCSSWERERWRASIISASLGDTRRSSLVSK